MYLYQIVYVHQRPYVQHREGGRYPATPVEIEFWNRLQSVTREKETLVAQVKYLRMRLEAMQNKGEEQQP
jgi:hypothetical protein